MYRDSFFQKKKNKLNNLLLSSNMHHTNTWLQQVCVS